jgi:hypothetical protein
MNSGAMEDSAHPRETKVTPTPTGGGHFPFLYRAYGLPQFALIVQSCCRGSALL